MTRWMRPVAAAFAVAVALAGPGMPDPRAADFTNGRLLVATEGMPDPRFARAVVFMVEHDAGGAMGLVINKPLAEMPFAELAETARIEVDDPMGTLRVHFGGPMQSELAFVLHPAGPEWDNTVPVGERYAMSSGNDALAALAQGEGPDRYVFALGYAGWAPGQLDRELSDDMWIVIPPEDDLIFPDEPEGIWKRALARRGIEL